MKKKDCKINKIYVFLANHLQWLGFTVVLFAVLFAYITVLFEPKEVVLDVIYFLMFALLLTGIYFEFRNQKEAKKKIIFKLEDFVSVTFGVFLTYSLVHFFSLNVIISASSVGLLGAIGLKKHQIPIYCGAFAGMVSVVLFSFLEVLILSVICSIIYTLSKTIFNGFGGKLGTIAFLSSLIVHSIFQDEFITVQIDFNIFILILVTTFSVLLTFYLQHLLKISAVLASSLPSLLFAIIFIYFFPNHLDYVVVFFSASFIGMSSKERLPTILSVILSGVILGLIYDVFLELFNGLGGKLGLMAMISVIITTSITNIFKKKKTIK